MTQAITTNGAPNREDVLRGAISRMADQWPETVNGRGKFEAFAVAACLKSPELRDCTDVSKLKALNHCAMLGLIPGKENGHCYILPYNRDATVIVGYRGLIELASRSGKVRGIVAHIVFEHDEFDHRMGTNESITHRSWRQIGKEHGGDIIAAYCVATVDGEKQHTVMYADEINAIRDRGRGNNRGPWATDYAEMAKKTVIRRAAKTWPLTAEQATAIGLGSEDPDVIDTTAEVRDALPPSEPQRETFDPERVNDEPQYDDPSVQPSEDDIPF